MDVDEVIETQRNVTRRRNAMANIFEQIKPEDMILLNLDYEITNAANRKIEKDYLHATQHSSQTTFKLLESRSRSLVFSTDDLNQHLSDLIQNKNKIFKRN